MDLDLCALLSDSPTMYWKLLITFEELLIVQAEATGCRLCAGWRNWRKLKTKPAKRVHNKINISFTSGRNYVF